MNQWLRRIRGAVGMGLTWAIGWTVVGMPIMLIADEFFGFDSSVVDIWLPVFAYPGFLGGVAFSVVLGIAGGRRRFDEMSLARFAGWGALGGLLLSGFIIAASGFASISLIVASIVTPLCAGSAAGSLALARRAKQRELLGGGDGVSGA